MVDTNVIVGGVAAVVGVAVGIAIGYKAHKMPDPDLTAIKRSIEERFKDAHDSKLGKDLKEEIFRRVLENAKRDIRAMYPEQYHQELFAYTDVEYKRFFDMK